MNLNRLVGSTVFISILLILILYFYPSDVSNQNVISKVIEPEAADTMIAVSYTHLTLQTILLV